MKTRGQNGGQRRRHGRLYTPFKDHLTVMMKCWVGRTPPDLKANILTCWVGVTPQELKSTVHLALNLRAGTPSLK